MGLTAHMSKQSNKEEGDAAGTYKSASPEILWKTFNGAPRRGCGTTTREQPPLGDDRHVHCSTAAAPRTPVLHWGPLWR